jgi:hypothetical protein
MKKNNMLKLGGLLSQTYGLSAKMAFLMGIYKAYKVTLKIKFKGCCCFKLNSPIP